MPQKYKTHDVTIRKYSRIPIDIVARQEGIIEDCLIGLAVINDYIDSLVSGIDYDLEDWLSWDELIIKLSPMGSLNSLVEEMVLAITKAVPLPINSLDEVVGERIREIDGEEICQKVTLRQELMGIYKKLLIDSRLQHGNHLGFLQWMMFEYQIEIQQNIEDRHQHETDGLQMVIDNIDYDVELGIRDVIANARVAESRKKLQFKEIEFILYEEGYFDLSSFEAGTDTLTKAEIHNLCQQKAPDLFRMGFEAFKNLWKEFNSHRQSAYISEGGHKVIPPTR